MKNTDTEIQNINNNVDANNINNFDIINNINNEKINPILNPKQTTQIKINQHHKKDSVLLPMNNNSKNHEENNDDTGTMVTQVQLLGKKEDNKDTIYELNKSLEKTDDSSKGSSKNEEDQKDPNQQNESFFQKTKRWAGNVWSYVNVANYFPKAEFKEYRNANGDWVKIPVKKTPLKKKKIEETEEEHIVNKTQERDRINLANATIDRIPIPNFL